MAVRPKRCPSRGVLPAVPTNKRKRARATTPDDTDDTQAARLATKKTRGRQAKPNPPASSKRYAEVVAALQEDDTLEKGVRDMLVNGFGEDLLTRSPKNLHSFQFQFLGFIEEALGRIEARFVANLADAKDAYDKVAGAGPEFEGAQQAASMEFGASVAASKVKETAVESSATAVDVAKGSVTVAEAQLCVSDLAIGTAAMERHQLEVILNDPSSAPVALLARLVPDCAEDSGLTFSELVGKVREAIELRDRTVRDGAAARVALHTTLEDARTALKSAEMNHAVAREALNAVSATRYEKAKQLKNAWDNLRNLPAEQSRTEEQFKLARKKLADFQAGPMTTVRTVMQGPTAPTTPSVVSAEIRRRRSSFLPRKLISMARRSSLASKRPSNDDDDSDGDVATAQVHGRGQKVSVAPGEPQKASTRKHEDVDAEDTTGARSPMPSRRSLGTKE